MISKIISSNGLSKGHYAEPYAGGGGLALSLLLRGYVHELHLNDLDPSIWAFWDSILNKKDDFIQLVRETPITIDEWKKQRDVQENKFEADPLELGFSSFFLNRTNRSGVIQKAGVIGGLAQSGKYKIDCRFNREGLVEKINRISEYRHRIHLYNMDAIQFIKATRTALPNKTLYCIDPPYFVKGSTLYTNFYEPKDHAEIARLLNRLGKPWLLTYDNSPEIQKLYPERRQFNFNLNYSAADKKVGTELLIVSDKIDIPADLNINKVAV